MAEALLGEAASTDPTPSSPQLRQQPLSSHVPEQKPPLQPPLETHGFQREQEQQRDSQQQGGEKLKGQDVEGLHKTNQGEAQSPQDLKRQQGLGILENSSDQDLEWKASVKARLIKRQKQRLREEEDSDSDSDSDSTTDSESDGRSYSQAYSCSGSWDRDYHCVVDTRGGVACVTLFSLMVYCSCTKPKLEEFEKCIAKC